MGKYARVTVIPVLAGARRSKSVWIWALSIAAVLASVVLFAANSEYRRKSAEAAMLSAGACAKGAIEVRVPALDNWPFRGLAQHLCTAEERGVSAEQTSVEEERGEVGQPSTSGASAQTTTIEREGEMGLCSTAGRGLLPAVWRTDRGHDGHIIFQGWTFAYGNNPSIRSCDLRDGRLQPVVRVKPRPAIVSRYPAFAPSLVLERGRPGVDRYVCSKEHTLHVLDSQGRMTHTISDRRCDIGPMRYTSR